MGALSFKFLGNVLSGGLAEALLEVGADGLDEVGAVHSLGLNTFHQVHEVLGNDTGIQRVEALFALDKEYPE